MLECKLTTQQAADVAGVKFRTLDHWIRTNLVTCETPAAGTGTARRWSFQDVIRVRTVAELKRRGANVRNIRAVTQALTERWAVRDPLSDSTRWVVIGRQLFWAETDEQLLDALSGQLAAAPLLVVPLGEIMADVRRLIKELAA